MTKKDYNFWKWKENFEKFQSKKLDKAENALTILLDRIEMFQHEERFDWFEMVDVTEIFIFFPL